jgi:hypothetical protein
MKKLDRSALPMGVSLVRKEGLYAELDSQGQVVHLGVYQNGKLKPETWSLDVAPDGSWARVQQTKIVEWPRDAFDEEAGASTPLAEWAHDWMKRIAEGMDDRKPANLTCSFCGKGQREVKKLIAGPSVFICDECIGLCSDIIAEEEASKE